MIKVAWDSELIGEGGGGHESGHQIEPGLLI